MINECVCVQFNLKLSAVHLCAVINLMREQISLVITIAFMSNAHTRTHAHKHSHIEIDRTTNLRAVNGHAESKRENENKFFRKYKKLSGKKTAANETSFLANFFSV